MSVTATVPALVLPWSTREDVTELADTLGDLLDDGDLDVDPFGTPLLTVQGADIITVAVMRVMQRHFPAALAAAALACDWPVS